MRVVHPTPLTPRLSRHLLSRQLLLAHQLLLPVPAPVPQTGAQTQTISVTQEEAEQIEQCTPPYLLTTVASADTLRAQIMGMGFDRQAVLQAYVACERNAERAVEFLLAGAFE
jgi:hypothetical protein